MFWNFVRSHYGESQIQDMQQERWKLVVATQIFFIVTPKLGEMIHFDEHIFQLGWFNHQLDDVVLFF